MSLEKNEIRANAFIETLDFRETKSGKNVFLKFENGRKKVHILDQSKRKISRIVFLYIPDECIFFYEIADG